MSIDHIRGVLTRRMTELDMTPYRLRQLSGVDEHVIERFLYEGANPQINTITRLLEVVGVELIPRPIKGYEPPPPARGRGRPKKVTGPASS